VITDNHRLDLAAAVHQKPQLPTGLFREVGHTPCQIPTYDLINRHPFGCQAIKSAMLRRFEPGGISCYFCDGFFLW
jgi:hypothetical protein